ncbi:DNA polymerase zeta catalytic subunit [Andrographis paniculata]|uniref:DNA polymerase zeta catalytic subunit n=1 Tax=Andrographis paniculata TaxID=175694 RepID=UPI0021E8FBED|nr:DNA polymerase zeta catalytic subunit [Andrographis paniculata]
MEDSQAQLFSVRIVSIDYYTATPIPGLDTSYSTFHGGRVKEVPVIRIYGSTPAGQKTCLHVHQVLPYLYIPCSDLGTVENVEAHRHSLCLAFEKALQLKGNVGSKRQHVHGCDLVRARKFYGYHSSEELFVKIYFYYPQDVSRAAKLLLAGGILDRILQPYESHIPFLLQFLIDYNLYGMSHLHASKVKFRHPVPDAFSRQKVELHDSQRPIIKDSNSMNSQADLIGDLCLNTPVWISSTIPDEWIWQYSSQSDSSTNEEISLYRRQSTSELEVDASVHDIVNQQSVSFTPLSQTNLDVKMVQSLIPIWEEEHARNGVPEAIPANSQKPFPQDVLRILSDGFGFEEFLQMQNTEDWPSLTPEPMKSSADSGDLTGSEIANLENSKYLPSKYLKASELKGSLMSQDSLFRSADDAETEKVDAGDKLQLSGTIGSTGAKDADEDALRLLNWLASSQAAEDINSDDELVREAILSPFVPSNEISEVLKRANVDYESESQKECQDILDSVDLINLEESNDGAFKPAKSSHSRKVSLKKMIPQLDGSSDDPPSSPSSGKYLKTEYGNPELEQLELDSDLICKPRRKRPRWGSLPISHKKLSDSRHPDTSGFLNVPTDTKRKGLGTSRDEVKRDKDVNFAEPGSVVVECSTRDLMRKKRSHRIVSSGCKSREESWQAESCSDIECGEKEVNTMTKVLKDTEEDQSFLSIKDESPVRNELTKCYKRIMESSAGVYKEASHAKPIPDPVADYLPQSSSNDKIDAGNLQKNLDPNCDCVACGKCIHNLDTSAHVCSCKLDDAPVSTTIGTGFVSSVLQTCDTGSFNVPSSSTPINLLPRNDCTGESCSQLCKLPNIPSVGSKSTKSATCLQLEHSPSHGRIPSLSTQCDALNVNEEAGSEKLIGMAFCKKPPIIDWTNEPKNDVPVLLGSGDCEAGISLQGRLPTGCLPFFTKSSQDKLNGVSPKKSMSSVDDEPVMGVPIMYQNDGSCLFMLTPAVSPPSRDSIENWLSNDCSKVFPKASEMPPLVSTSKAFLDDIVDSQSSQSVDGNSPFLTPASLPDEMCDSSLQANHNQETCSVKVQAFNWTPKNKSPIRSHDTSQISCPDKKILLTPLSQIGFRDPASVGQGQQLTLLSIEVLAESRGDLRPDPRFDAVNIIVIVLQEDDRSKIDTQVLLRCNSANVKKDLDAVPESKVFVFPQELHMFNHFTKVIRASDPDILMGWDVQSGSLGFLAERAAHLGIGLLNNISRTPLETPLLSRECKANEKESVSALFSELATADAANLETTIIEDEWGRTHASGIHVSGRIVLNIWRLMRNEVKLNIYTVEAVAETVLKRKVPYIPWKVLTKWFSSGPGQARYKSVHYILERAKLNLQIMNQLDMINRTSELARVFGIDFFSVLSRGSQYRVESMFLRLAHTQNYLAISPGNQQVAGQPAMECLPLVLEPESRFYADPVIVLDFQSLYPSMVIAYNLCFCTCLGKITPSKANILGVTSYLPDVNIMRSLKHELLLTPNGVAYVPPKVQKGILPRLLEELLSTRIMVKQAMKKLASSEVVRHRILNARQLALKLIANVTYGYTAAGFSGRMPCAELADSIVQCGRRTLETAISFVNSNDKWKARVVYGDTDSMFVLLKGRSLEEAFVVGREIASAISEMNPSPVTLKMEKVYYPCFLLTKKRYVGYSHESPDQSKPIFDAKGIETVRRDTCGAVSKIMEQSLRIYFESQDIDKVKAYLLRQWTRILSGRVSLQDFIFAKEVRLGTYSDRSHSLPPAAIVATKSMKLDPRAEPRYAERIPYVVVHGEPGARLVDMVVDPLELLALDSPFRLNDIYYIKKQIIPALQRAFGLIGVDLHQWFLDMPRPARRAVGKQTSIAPNPQRTRIDYYYSSKHCILCGETVEGSAHLCPNCSKDKTTVVLALTGRTSKLEEDIQHLAAICRHCGGGDWVVESGVKCTSLACSVFFERMKVQKELRSFSRVATTMGFYPKCIVECMALSHILCRRFKSSNPLSLHLLSQFRNPPCFSSLSAGMAPDSTSQPPPAAAPKPSSLSARMNFIFEQIDEIDKRREEKDETLQRIRAWRESRKQQGGQTGADSVGEAEVESMEELKSEMEKSEELLVSSGAKKEVELVHPWPDWIQLMERLVQQNYFDDRRKDEDGMIRGIGFDLSGAEPAAADKHRDFTRDFQTVQNAVINFGRDRFDILRSLSRHDLQILVGYGCPSADKRVVFSAKVLRKHVHLDEGDVCSSCTLRNSCEKAYLLTNKEDEARTMDVMRILLAYGFDPTDESAVNKSIPKLKTVKKVAQKLLHEVVRLSAVPIDPNLPPPVIKRPPPKVKQPPPPPRKRIGRYDVEMKKGDWLCTKCDFLNFAKNTVCLQCDAKRPKRQLLPGEWECPQCNFLNYRRNTVCFHCEHKRPPDTYTENQFPDKQRGPRISMDKVDRKNISNAWNFDFDDDESDGAEVAAFEYADSKKLGDDFSHEKLNLHENGMEDSRRPHMGFDRDYSNSGNERSNTGFNDFDDDDDDVDNYELVNQNEAHKVSRVNFSDVEADSDSEDTESRRGNFQTRRKPQFAKQGKIQRQRGKAFSDADDSGVDFDTDDDLPAHRDWKSSHVADSKRRNTGRRAMDFGSDDDLGFDSDDSEDDPIGSRNKANKRASGAKNCPPRGRSDFKSEPFRGADSDDDHRSYRGPKQRSAPGRRSGFKSGRFSEGDSDDDHRSYRGPKQRSVPGRRSGFKSDPFSDGDSDNEQRSYHSPKQRRESSRQQLGRGPRGQSDDMKSSPNRGFGRSGTPGRSNKFKNSNNSSSYLDDDRYRRPRINTR